MFFPDSLLQILRQYTNFTTFLVGYSGGMDSTVLLHAIQRIRHSLNADIRAIHVHHGLQATADQWEEHCREVSRNWSVAFLSARVNATAGVGESPEAAARSARYNAIRAHLNPNVCLLTAHHQQDQAETFILQMLRGAGPAGLAAMPESKRLGAGWHLRPLLTQSREDLREYAENQQLVWIEDPSNSQLNADRNYLRHKVLPILRSRWPAVDETVARVARIQSDIPYLLADLATLDYQSVSGSVKNTLSVSGLMKLDEARRSNLLRTWIKQLALPTPNGRQLTQIMSDILAARWDSTPCLSWKGAEIRRYRDDLYAMPPLSRHDAQQVINWTTDIPLHIPHLNITMNIDILKAMGLTLSEDVKILQVRFRRGGETCRPLNRQYHHDLKKLLQSAGVPPWQRNRIPLIYSQGELLAVGEYWICY